MGPLAQLGPGPVGPIGPVGPGNRWAHWPSWAWEPFGPIGPHPTDIQAAYRYTDIRQVDFFEQLFLSEGSPLWGNPFSES